MGTVMRWLVVLGWLLSAGCDQVFGLSERDAGANADANTDANSGRIQYIQSKSTFMNKVGILSLAFDQKVLTGDLVVVAIGIYDGTIQTVTDSAGNQYGEPQAVPQTAAGGNLHVLYAPNVVTATPFTVTVTSSVSDTLELTLAIHAYRGAAAEPFDQSNAKAGGPDFTPTSGPVTTTLDGELYFGAMSHDSNVITTPGGGFTVREIPTEDPANVPMATEDRSGPARTNVAATFVLDAQATWACALLTFK
jgi:hypothetical protein